MIGTKVVLSGTYDFIGGEERVTNIIVQQPMVTLTSRPFKFSIESKVAFAHSSSARCRPTEFFPFAAEWRGANKGKRLGVSLRQFQQESKLICGCHATYSTSKLVIVGITTRL